MTIAPGVEMEDSGSLEVGPTPHGEAAVCGT